MKKLQVTIQLTIVKEYTILIWEIETSYDALKNSLKIERITAKKRLTIEQDFYSQVVKL